MSQNRSSWWVGSSPTPMFNLSLNFKSRAWRNFLFSSEQQISHFFFSVVVIFFLANVYFVYSSLASIAC